MSSPTSADGKNLGLTGKQSPNSVKGVGTPAGLSGRVSLTSAASYGLSGKQSPANQKAGAAKKSSLGAKSPRIMDASSP